MIAGHIAIKRMIEDGTWRFTSYDGEPPHIGPNSIDVRLFHKVLLPLPTAEIVEMNKTDGKTLFMEKDISEGHILCPGEFLLASVMESIDCSQSQHIQQYDGRSTVARMGIFTHTSAGYGDFKFSGSFTLEIYNAGPFYVKLVPGMRIGQVYFSRVEAPGEYEGYDQTDFHPAPPRLGPGRI